MKLPASAQPDPELDDLGLAVNFLKNTRKKEALVLMRRVLALISMDDPKRVQVLEVFSNRLQELSRDLNE